MHAKFRILLNMEHSLLPQAIRRLLAVARYAHIVFCANEYNSISVSQTKLILCRLCVFSVVHRPKSMCISRDTAHKKNTHIFSCSEPCKINLHEIVVSHMRSQSQMNITTILGGFFFSFYEEKIYFTVSVPVNPHTISFFRSLGGGNWNSKSTDHHKYLKRFRPRHLATALRNTKRYKMYTH